MKCITRGVWPALALLLTACAPLQSAPVQEMSDARQALAAAQAVGAERHASAVYRRAVELMRHAERSLSDGAYTSARRYAIDARLAAVRARESAAIRHGAEP